jgi:uncharacterized membrane protein (Fun14 family)
LLLSEVAQIEGILLNKYFLMQLLILNKNGIIHIDRWEKFVKLTFSMLQKKYISVFFYGLN